MGSPLSLIVAELVLDRLFMTKNNFNDDIKFMTKYDDDYLFLIRNNMFQTILTFFKYVIFILVWNSLLKKKWKVK